MLKQRNYLHTVLIVKCPNPTEEPIMGVSFSSSQYVRILLCSIILFVCLFETVSHYIAVASLEHYLDQASLKVIEICLPQSAGTKRTYHHTQLYVLKSIKNHQMRTQLYQQPLLHSTSSCQSCALTQSKHSANTGNSGFCDHKNLFIYTIVKNIAQQQTTYLPT